MSDELRIPQGPVDRSPVGFMPAADQLALVHRVLAEAGVELGAYDERMAEWVAGWDWPTVAVIASWVQRAGGETA